MKEYVASIHVFDNGKRIAEKDFYVLEIAMETALKIAGKFPHVDVVLYNLSNESMLIF